MNRTITKRIVALSLAAMFMFMAISPIFAQAQTTVPGAYKNGPYVDKIVFDVITQDDQQVLALVDNEIDVIDQQIDPTFLETLLEAEDIEVVNTLRNGYGYVSINCAKYPLNITAFRRAVAFATDKEAISDSAWDGLSEPQDSCVPKTNPFTIEGQLPYTYYEANVERGIELLDEAGFLDTNADGIREAPDGSAFDILVECAQSSNIAIEVGQFVADAMVSLGIDARSEPTDFYEYLNRLYYHGDYDMVFLGTTYTTFDVDWLAYNYWSEYIDEPFQNACNFANASYDAWRDQLLTSTDYDEVYEAAVEMQKIWTYEVPELICYENIQLTAYRTDTFEGFVEDNIDGIPSWWTNYKVHLKDDAGGPFGGTLRWCNSQDIDTFNFMASTSGYSQNINQMMWDTLLATDHEGNDIPWLAEDWSSATHADDSAVPEGYTRFQFDMIQNATWTDGTPLTGEDVAFTLNFMRDAPGNPYGPDLQQMTAAYAPTTYSVVIEFNTESYWHLHTVAYKPVLPKHVFEIIGAESWNLWNPNPPTTPMVTSGPFMVSDYVAGEFTELTYNPDYFYGLEHINPTSTDDSTTDDTTTGGFNPVLALVAGGVGAAVIILVGGFVLLRQK
ncbi:MAG: ABC transporter substrate-binding protein [Candidatus Thorarchaeota archaeon]